MTTPIELQVARLIGERRYFTGKPCKQGHVAYRNVTDSSCMECRRLTQKRLRPWLNEWVAKQRAADPEGYAAKQAEYTRKYVAQSPERYREYRRRERRKWRAQNPTGAIGSALHRRRTPAWADTSAMREFYKNRPAGMEVDHIIPLRGKTASGLHVIENVQYLTPEQNAAKGNRFNDWGDQ